MACGAVESSRQSGRFMHSYSVAGGAARAVAVPWLAYWRLCKPKVVLLIAFTAVVGMFLSTAGTHAVRFGRGTTRLVSWPV